MTKPTGPEDSEADSAYTPAGPTARARGAGAVAASGDLDTTARGTTAAATSRSGRALAEQVLSEEQIRGFAGEVAEFPEPYKQALAKCLQVASNAQLDASNARETADDLWAQNVAVELRKGTAMQRAATGLLTKILEATAGGLLPKVVSMILGSPP